MKWSKIVHGVAAVTGVAGLFAILGAWLSGQSGSILGLSQGHLYSDAMVLLLASVAFGVATLIHQNQER